MRECTKGTVLYAGAVFIYKRGSAGTVCACIERTIAEKAVEIFHSLMAGIIFAVLVCKKSAAVFHTKAPSAVSIQSASFPSLS